MHTPTMLLNIDFKRNTLNVFITEQKLVTTSVKHIPASCINFKKNSRILFYYHHHHYHHHQTIMFHMLP